jgi:hypothetical protein
MTALHPQALRPRSPSPATAPEIVAHLSYLTRGSQTPYSYAYEPPPGTPWESAEHETHEVRIADGRAAPTPQIDREGFELRDAPTTMTSFADPDAIEAGYYPEAAALALAVTGGARAYVFDHLMRRREALCGALTFGRSNPDGVPSANGRVHNDYTEDSGRRRYRLVLPAEEDRAPRYCIVNIWRSIRGPVVDTPLAVCDARTVMADDLVRSEVRYPSRTGEIYLATYSPLHRWTYFSAMDRHEALVFKQYDSALGRIARFTPHAAFELPDVPPEAPRRESIEVRCLVVFAP